MAKEEKIRINLSEDEIMNLNKQEIFQKWKLQDEYLISLEEKLQNTKMEYEKKLKDLEDNKNLEICKLKNLLLMKYMIREQEQSVINNDLNNSKN